MRERVVAFAALTLTLVTMTAGVAAPAGPLRMTVGALGHIGSIDPRHGDSEIAGEVWKLQYPTLTALNPETFAPTTGVADGWRPTASGHGWIYSIRRGLTWSDGSAVTPADVVYSLDHARDDHWPYAAGMLDGLRAHAVNDHAVAVTSNRTIAPGLMLHVVPAHMFSKYADIDGQPAAFGVGDGPWHVVAEDTSSVRLGVLGRPGGPPLDEIVFRAYPNADALIAALEDHDADVISGVPDADIDRLEGVSGVTVNHAGDGTEWVLRFASFPDAGMRQGVSLAIDRTELVADAVNGVGTVAALPARPDQARKDLGSAARRLPTTIAVPTDATGRRVGVLVRRALAAGGLPTRAVAGNVRADLVIEHVRVADVPRGTVALFAPDTLQAFRTDNVTGFLREPSEASLVVFGPTVSQYGAITAAQKPPGEQLSNTAYAIGAAGLLVLFAGVYLLAAVVRKRNAT